MPIAHCLWIISIAVNFFSKFIDIELRTMWTENTINTQCSKIHISIPLKWRIKRIFMIQLTTKRTNNNKPITQKRKKSTKKKKTDILCNKIEAKKLYSDLIRFGLIFRCFFLLFSSNVEQLSVSHGLYVAVFLYYLSICDYICFYYYLLNFMP